MDHALSIVRDVVLKVLVNNAIIAINILTQQSINALHAFKTAIHAIAQALAQSVYWDIFLILPQKGEFSYIIILRVKVYLFLQYKYSCEVCQPGCNQCKNSWTCEKD